MRKTAGYCVTGQERGGGRRYARIELSEKVCDSAGRALFKPDRPNNKLSAADMHCHLFCIVNTFSSSIVVSRPQDRLRDTLIHEMCHAATWLINGVRDGHGNFWKLYARKSTLAHPELPMVTRCHSYDIKYKFQYKCTRCQNTYV